MKRHIAFAVVYLALLGGAKYASAQNFDIICQDKLVGYESVAQGEYTFVFKDEGKPYTHEASEQDSGMYDEHGVWHEMFFHDKIDDLTKEVIKKDRVSMTVDIYGVATVKGNGHNYKRCHIIDAAEYGIHD